MAWFFIVDRKRPSTPLRSSGSPDEPELSHEEREKHRRLARIQLVWFLVLLIIMGGFIWFAIKTEMPFDGNMPANLSFYLGDYYVVGEGWKLAGVFAGRTICEKNGVYRDCFPVRVSPDQYATLQAKTR